MQLAIKLVDFGIPAASTESVEQKSRRTPSEELPDVVPSAPTKPAAIMDIRTLKEQKKPASARQMACIVAFYLQELAPAPEKKESVNASDLDKYFKQAGFKLPGKMSQVLIDLKAAGYLDIVARGEYKLNAVGYNLVAHNLPGSAE
jgi:hypothetical protein